MLAFARALPRVRRVVARDLDERRADARARARRRGAPARPRPLPHRQRGVRRGERQLRPRHARAAARHARPPAASWSSTTRPRAGSAASRRSPTPTVYEVVAELKRRRSSDRTLLAYRNGGWAGLRSDRRQRLPQGGRGRGLHGQGLPHVACDGAGGGRAWPSRREPRSETARKRTIAAAVADVAEHLGNTPAVCRASYIDPRVFDRYAEGATIATALASLDERGDGRAGVTAPHRARRARAARGRLDAQSVEPQLVLAEVELAAAARGTPRRQGRPRGGSSAAPGGRRQGGGSSSRAAAARARRSARPRRRGRRRARPRRRPRSRSRAAARPRARRSSTVVGPLPRLGRAAQLAHARVRLGRRHLARRSSRRLRVRASTPRGRAACS